MGATVAAWQLAIEDLQVERNCTTIERAVSQLSSEVDIVCFPELALTGFTPDQRITEVALSIDASPLDSLRALASTETIDVMVGFAEQAGNRTYNTTAYIHADGTLDRYRKRHLWGDEREVFTPGSTQQLVETPAGRTGILTCYDLNFVHESAALTEAQVDALLIAGAWPYRYRDNWRLLARARALDGVRWVVGAGRTGTRTIPGLPPMQYAGGSLVVRPNGEIVEELDTREGHILADLSEETLAGDRALIGIYAPHDASPNG